MKQTHFSAPAALMTAFALSPLASAQIPAAKVLFGGPGAAELQIVRHLDADATGSWAASINTGGQIPAQSLYGYLEGTGMTEPGLLREAQTMAGFR